MVHMDVQEPPGLNCEDSVPGKGFHLHSAVCVQVYML